MSFQYFCSAKGFLRHYPGITLHVDLTLRISDCVFYVSPTKVNVNSAAAAWDSMFKLSIGDDGTDVYDCRQRPWYAAAGGAPRDVLILLDASGSMTNSSNLVIAQKFTMALLSVLTDDDQVNVLRFNLTTRSPISCFKDILIPVNIFFLTNSIVFLFEP